MGDRMYIVLKHGANRASLHAVGENSGLLEGIGHNAICFLTYANDIGIKRLLSDEIAPCTTCLINKIATDYFCFMLTRGTQHLDDYAEHGPADFIGSVARLESFLDSIDAPEEQIRLEPEMEPPF